MPICIASSKMVNINLVNAYVVYFFLLVVSLFYFH